MNPWRTLGTPPRIRPLMCIPVTPAVRVRTRSTGAIGGADANRAVITIEGRATIVHVPGRATLFTHGIGSTRVRL